jgi:4-hydroxy-tetrahydrodipicolinate synthase
MRKLRSRPRLPTSRARLYHRGVLGEVLTASVTPFDSDGAVNLPKFRELATFLVDNGSDGLVVTGSTGESATLTDDERFDLYSTAVETVGDRATVIAGTGTYDTRHSVHLTERAHELGVDGFLIVTPYYNKPPPRGIVEHVKAIAAVTDKPIVYYNIPARVVNLVSVETLAELAEIPNVIAVKQAWDDLEDARRIVEETTLDLYAGDDNLVLPFLELGGTGGVCVHTHVVGPQVREQITSFRRGDTETAGRIDDELAPVYEILKVTVGPIGIKAALNLLGHDVGGLRLPLVEATHDEHDRIRGHLKRLGVLEPVSA